MRQVRPLTGLILISTSCSSNSPEGAMARATTADFSNFKAMLIASLAPLASIVHFDYDRFKAPSSHELLFTKHWRRLQP
jgi:hypothetical protein